MKQKLGRPPLIQIDMNEVGKNSANQTGQTSFSTQMNQIGLKEGVFVNSPTPNFISPSNKQNQQQIQLDGQLFSHYHQLHVNQQNHQSDNHFNQLPDSNKNSDKYISNDKPSRVSFSSHNESSKQIQQLGQMREINQNKENKGQRNQSNQDMVSSYYQRIQQFNDFAKNKKQQQQQQQQHANRNGTDEYNFHTYQLENNSHQPQTNYRDISPQQKNKSNYSQNSNSNYNSNGSALSQLRLKSIAKSTQSFIKNSTSTPISIQPQRISVDISEFIVKKPPQPPSNSNRNELGGISLRQSTPNNLTNITHNFNDKPSNLLNLTPKSQYIKTQTSKSPLQQTSKSPLQQTSKSPLQQTSKSFLQQTSKSPSHKSTKSLMDFIKNGISNSTKNQNKPLNQTGRLFTSKERTNQKIKKNHLQQNTTISERYQNKINERNGNSIGRRDSQKINQKLNKSVTNVKVSNYNWSSNRSGQKQQNNVISDVNGVTSLCTSNLDQNNTDKSYRVVDDHHLQSPSKGFHLQKISDSNSQKNRSPNKNDDVCETVTLHNQSDILYKNSTKAITIKQQVLQDSLKKIYTKRNQEVTRYATDADQAYDGEEQYQFIQQDEHYQINLGDQMHNKDQLNNEDEEFIQEEERINFMDQQSKEEEVIKQNQQGNNQMATPNEDQTSYSYRKMMTVQAQIAKEHPTPSQIKYLQSNQKNKYFEKNYQDDTSFIIEKYDTDCTNRTQLQTLVVWPQSSLSPLKNQVRSHVPHCENLEESFQALHNCHSMQKLQFQSGTSNVQSQTKDTLNPNHSQPFTLNNTTQNSNDQTNYQQNLITLPITYQNYSPILPNQLYLSNNNSNDNNTNNNNINNNNNQLFQPIRSSYSTNLDDPYRIDSATNQLKESMQTSSEKHLFQQYPFLPENNSQSDSKEVGMNNKNTQEQQFGTVYENNQSQTPSIFPITNMTIEQNFNNEDKSGYDAKQIEYKYLMERLYQLQQQQQQNEQQEYNNDVNHSKLERCFIVTTEELGAELQENKVSTNRLLEHVQYLENRITKLVTEDENLEKRIVNITYRKGDISMIKMKNQEDNLRLQHLKQRQQEQMKEMKRKISQGRMQSKERLERSKMQNQMQKRQAANSVKETSMINKSILDESRNQEALRNSFIINSIKNLERKLVEDKHNRAINSLQQSKLNQINKIEYEKEQQQQLQQKINDLQCIEQQLIENLEQKYENNKQFLYI